MTALPTSRPPLAETYSSLVAFLCGALALTAPSGYSIGPVLLLLASLSLVFRRPKLRLDGQDRAILLVLLGYAALLILFAGLHREGSSGLADPLRFLLAVPVLIWLLAHPPRLAWLWAGFALGAVGAGTFAAWQKFALGLPRPDGFSHAIQFGNLCVLLATLCLAGLGWASTRARRGAWYLVLGLGALGGLTGSILSGSRGGWVALLPMLAVLVAAFARRFSWKAWGALVGAGVVVAALAWVIPQTGIQKRYDQAVAEITQYASGERISTSIGRRFDMWKGAVHLFQEKPLLGWGESAYRPAMQALAEEGRVHPDVGDYDHAHNEFFDRAAKQGAVGLLGLLALYGVPLLLFGRGLWSPDIGRRALAAAGCLLPIGFMGFGLTQSFLAHNSGVTVYAFWLVLLWSAFRHVAPREAQVPLRGRAVME
ncbi:O-antigen ligase family protein [Halomonas organivorans]